MKKFVFLLLLMVCDVAAYGIDVALPTYKYIKYGGGLELIVKTQSKTGRYTPELRSYGIRKSGNILLNPEYSVNEATFPADLYLLVFMKHSERTIHVYDTESGEEILFYHYDDSLLNDGEIFCGFAFTDIVTDGKRRYQLVAKIEGNGETVSRVIAIFYREHRKTYFLKP